MALPDYSEVVNIGINDAFRTSQPVTLTVKPHGAFSKNSVDILGNNGMPLMECRGALLTKRREFFTTDGTPLFSLHRHSFDRQNMFTLDRPDGPPFLRIHRHWTLGRTKLDAHFMNVVTGASQEEVVLEIRYHGFTSRETSITWNGRAIATVQREGTFRKEWKVRVEPGVDQALIAALTVAMIVVYREQQARAASSSGGGGGA